MENDHSTNSKMTILLSLPPKMKLLITILHTYNPVSRSFSG